MLAHEEIVRRLTEARLEAYDPVVTSWQGDELRRGLETETRQLLRRTTDVQLGEQAMTRLPELGITDPTKFLDAVVQLPSGGSALAGIRFRGGDPDRPFVDILAMHSAAPDRLGRDLAAVADRWSAFAPLCVRMSAPSPNAVPFVHFGPSSRADLLIVAGRVTDIRDRRLPHLPGLQIETATDLSWYPLYRQEYEQFLAADPQRRQWTQPESRHSLARTCREGGVFLVTVDGAMAGVYALPRATAHGLRGFRFQEKLLFSCVRGRGIAAIVEHEVVRRLTANADEVVVGAVEGRNLPSLRAAYRVGRRTVTARLWLTPPGYPGMPAV